MVTGIRITAEGGILKRERENLACNFSFSNLACRVYTGDLHAERFHKSKCPQKIAAKKFTTCGIRSPESFRG
jgi:hypothetical protein